MIHKSSTFWCKSCQTFPPWVTSFPELSQVSAALYIVSTWRISKTASPSTDRKHTRTSWRTQKRQSDLSNNFFEFRKRNFIGPCNWLFVFLQPPTSGLYEMEYTGDNNCCLKRKIKLRLGLMKQRTRERVRYFKCSSEVLIKQLM
jgi:hypothetical protein